jgi:hypothetical protein
LIPSFVLQETGFFYWEKTETIESFMEYREYNIEATSPKDFVRKWSIQSMSGGQVHPGQRDSE